MRRITAVLDLDNQFPYMVIDLPTMKPQKLIGMPVYQDGKIVGEILKATVRKTPHGNKLYLDINAFSNLESAKLSGRSSSGINHE